MKIVHIAHIQNYTDKCTTVCVDDIDIHPCKIQLFLCCISISCHVRNFGVQHLEALKASGRTLPVVNQIDTSSGTAIPQEFVSSRLKLEQPSIWKSSSIFTCLLKTSTTQGWTQNYDSSPWTWTVGSVFLSQRSDPVWYFDALNSGFDSATQVP